MDSFMDWFWLMVWWFLFIMYLILLFQIISDLFRDRDLSGWAKAAWLIGLLFLPFLIALIYVIARGKGMAERQVDQMKRAKADTDAYIRDVAGSTNGSTPASQISEAKALLDAGVIDENEFAKLKARALA